MKPLLPRLALGLFAAMFVAAQAAPGAAPDRLLANHPILAALQEARPELKLSSEQDSQWAAAEAASKAAREAMAADHQRMRAIMRQEGQKDVMDLASLDQQMEAMMAAGRKAREQAKERWLALYDSLSLEQKRIASQHIKDALARMDKLHEQLKATTRPAGS
ncbi:Spy/CpxP family protein refolding chaperone [Chitinimonas sp.]|uniref:Spy/CpxP family protein refolding chaperone n=1 Tax=Chitinimonas sp. TaxID=1934313 RepID=UPI0035B06ECE